MNTSTSPAVCNILSFEWLSTVSLKCHLSETILRFIKIYVNGK